MIGASFPTGLVFLRTFMDNARPVTICVYSFTHAHTRTYIYIYGGLAVGEG